MSDSYSVKAVLSVSDKNFTDKMLGAVDTLGDLDSASEKTSASLMDIMKGAGAFKVVSKAADILVNSLDGAVSRFDTLNQYPKVMQNLGYTAEEAGESLDKLSDGITGLPTALDDAATYTKQWALATGDLDKATDLYLAINDGAIAYGASAEKAASCQEQLNQMISTGTYDLQSWKILNQNCPGLLDAVAKSMLGESAAANDLRDALNDGIFTTDQFIDAWINLDQNGTVSITAFSEAAQSASGGISTSVANMKTAVVRGMENVIRSTNDALENNGLPGFQGIVESATAKINVGFAHAADGAEMLANSLDVLVPTLGTAAAGFAAYKVAMDMEDKHEKFQKDMEKSVDRLYGIQNATDLAAQATAAQESAVLSAEIAERKMAKARDIDAAAIKAQTEAKKLAVDAANAQNAASNAAKNAQSKLTQALKKQEAADKAAAKAAEADAKATELQKKAWEKAAGAGQAKTEAVKKQEAADKAAAKADELNARATKAQEEADMKASSASRAKAEAERMETIATEASTHAEEMSAAAEKAGADAAEVNNIQIAAKSALLGVLSGKYTLAEAGQLAWNAAMSANPIGTVITAAAILTTVLVGVATAAEKLSGAEESLWSSMRKAKNKNKELMDSLEESKSAYDSSKKEIEQTTDAVVELAGETAQLAGKTDRSADETATLKANVASLNGAIDGLNLAYDEETGLLNMSADALEKKASAYKAEEEASSAIEQRNDILKKQQSVMDSLSEAEKQLAEIEKMYYEEAETTGQVSLGTSAAYATQAEEVKKLKAEKKSLAEQEQEATETVTACQAAQAAAVTESQAEQQSALAESIANQTVQLSDLSEANQETVNTLQNAWQGYAEQARDMFNTLSDEQTVSVDQMIQNVQKNQQVISDWGSNMEALRDRFDNLGLSQGLLDDMADMGPEGAGYVAALVTASDEQLATLATTFDGGGTVAKDALLRSLGVDSNEIPDAVAGMIDDTESSLRERIEATDWTSLGETGIDGGVAEGIVSGSSTVQDAGANMTTDTRNAAGEAVGEGSPATAFIELGNNMVAGLAQGLSDGNAAIQAASSMAGSVVEAVRTAFDSADIASVSENAFSGMASAAQSGMARTSDTVRSGMNKVKQNAVTGMNQFENAINSGMNRAVAYAKSGSNRIVNATSGLRGRMYNSGYYASIGLANGINAGAGAAIAAADRLANKVAATMDKALEVGSPSRVTKKTGQFTTEGFVIGLLDYIHDVEAAGEELAEAAVPSGEIARSFAAVSSYTPDTSYRYAGEDRDTSPTYTIVAPLYIDGREFARSTVTYTQEELDKLKHRKDRKNGIRSDRRADYV